MRNNQRNENSSTEPMLSLEKAEEILRNVFRAAGVPAPANCTEILRKGAKGAAEESTSFVKENWTWGVQKKL